MMTRRVLGTAVLALCVSPLTSAQDLGVAQYADGNQLMFPENTDTWIHVGTSLGGEYSDEPFDAADPGVMGVVQMEPEAYRYFKEHQEYADGTLFLLSFYTAAAESSPQLPGFVQGELEAKEIHVIDRDRFNEGRAFYMYPAEAMPGTASNKIPDNSACIHCHIPEGAFDGTFTQFYPQMRTLLTE